MGMDIQLSQALTVFIWTSVIFLVVIGVFVGKLLYSLSKLTSNLNDSAIIVKREIEPILKNVGESADTINKIIQTTDKKVGKFSETYDKLTGMLVKSVTKASAISGFFAKTVFKGLFSLLKGLIKIK